jgi:hypothetical protein
VITSCIVYLPSIDEDDTLHFSVSGENHKRYGGVEVSKIECGDNISVTVTFLNQTSQTFVNLPFRFTHKL